jgi:hypothetical protein
MKKLLILPLLALLLSCNEEQINNNCHCTGKFTNPEMYPDVYYINNIEYDCNTGVLISPKNNDIFLGCK